jgi:hypothetical protein
MKKLVLRISIIIVMIVAIFIIVSTVWKIGDSVDIQTDSLITLTEFSRQTQNGQNGLMVYINTTSPDCVEFPYDLGMKLYVLKNGS